LFRKRKRFQHFQNYFSLQQQKGCQRKLAVLERAVITILSSLLQRLARHQYSYAQKWLLDIPIGASCGVCMGCVFLLLVTFIDGRVEDTFTLIFCGIWG
jgi:hypothetical protein